ncbi:MAG: caspase family protein [Isosphaeraceae bacterium]
MNRKTEFPASAPGCLTAMRLQLAVVAALLGMGTAAFPALGQESKKAQPTPPGTGASRGVERVPLADEGPVDYRARWAVIIGIDKYPGGKSGLEPLLFAANDAQAVRDILRDDYGYDKDHLLSVIDEEAPGPVTRQSMTEGLQRWLSERPIQQDDSVLVFFARQPAFYGMSAGRFTPVADGLGEERHSVFTAAFLTVLRERANSLRADHAFTFRQLAAEVESRVASALRSRQIPDWGRLGPGDGDFVFHQSVNREVPWERAEREARVSASRRYSALALAEFDSRPDTALLLGAMARETADTFEARSALVRNVSFHRA